MERSSQNRDGQAAEIPLNNPAISKKKKGAVASNVPECPMSAAQTIVPCVPTEKAKTTNLKNIQVMSLLCLNLLVYFTVIFSYIKY